MSGFDGDGLEEAFKGLGGGGVWSVGQCILTGGAVPTMLRTLSRSWPVTPAPCTATKWSPALIFPLADAAPICDDVGEHVRSEASSLE